MSGLHYYHFDFMLIKKFEQKKYLNQITQIHTGTQLHMFATTASWAPQNNNLRNQQLTLQMKCL